MWSPKPQDQQCREGEAHHRDQGECMPAAQQRRQKVMSGGGNPDRDRYRNADRNRAPQDRSAGRSPYFGAAIAVLQQRITEYQKRKSGVPDLV